LINNITIILVGNKFDEENNEENGRLIEYSEGEVLAKDHQFQFLETSALNGKIVDEVFNNISKLIINNLKDDRTSTSTFMEFGSVLHMKIQNKRNVNII
jgi:GTPase SAR1 family protein